MLVIEAKFAKTLQEKTIGLIRAEQIKPMYFKSRFGIHTFGMPEAIDVAILDKRNIIRSLVKNLPPNRVFFWHPKYDGVLELPLGTINKNNLTIGSAITLLLR